MSNMSRRPTTTRHANPRASSSSSQIVVAKRRPLPIIGTLWSRLRAIPAGFLQWRGRMSGSWVYRDVFYPALFGEIAEYEVIGSGVILPIVCFIAAIVMARYLGGVQSLKLPKIIITLALVVFGFYSFGNLQGPIFWADHHATNAAIDYNERGKYQPYRRFSRFYTQRSGANRPPLNVEDMRFLSELYLQYRAGVASAEALDGLKAYSVQDIAYFYSYFNIGEDCLRFPAEKIGTAVAQS